MSVRSAVEQEVHGLDANLPILQVRSLSDQIEISLYGYRLSAMLLAGFGLVALVLASLGLYGVIAHSVAQRTSEIGIRMALGAHPGEIFRLILGEG